MKTIGFGSQNGPKNAQTSSEIDDSHRFWLRKRSSARPVPGLASLSSLAKAIAGESPFHMVHTAMPTLSSPFIQRPHLGRSARLKRTRRVAKGPSIYVDTSPPARVAPRRARGFGCLGTAPACTCKIFTCARWGTCKILHVRASRMLANA